MMNCRVCQHEMMPLELVKNCRAEHLRYDSAPFVMRQADLLLYQCTHCTHIQLEYQLQQDYYQEYVGGSTGFTQYHGNLNQTDSKILKLSRYAAGKRNIIEIGCGTGRALEISKKYFTDCLGVEPSKNDAREAEKLGCSVLNAYFDPTLHLDQKFSAFQCFQVFEHLDDLYAVLNAAYDILEPGGVGLVNVPNGQEIVWQGYYHQVLAEHVNYFSPYSLAVMAHQAGFDVIEVESVADTIELDLYIRKQDALPKMNEQKQRQMKLLTRLLEGHSVISIWGAGAKAHIYSALLDQTIKISHLMDGSPSNIGKYISGISIPIEPVSQRAVQESDVIVIFASSYNDEIIKSLRERHHYQGAIIYFDGETIKKESLSS